MTVISTLGHAAWAIVRDWWGRSSSSAFNGVATILAVYKIDIDLLLKGLLLLIMFLAPIIVMYLIFKKVLILFHEIIAAIGRENTPWETYLVAFFELLSVYKFFTAVLTIFVWLLERIADTALSLHGCPTR
jgi:hypothetical protein